MRMCRAFMRAGAVAVAAWLAGWVGCAETVAPSDGWGMTDLPDVFPTAKDVVAASKAAVETRYPMVSALERSGSVIAFSPVFMDGGSKSRKQISVVALRNFTGAYEPVVRVRQFVEVGMPPLGTDPESANVSAAVPLVTHKWQALDFLPYEEQELYDDILARLADAKARGTKKAGEDKVGRR